MKDPPNLCFSGRNLEFGLNSWAARIHRSGLGRTDLLPLNLLLSNRCEVSTIIENIKIANSIKVEGVFHPGQCNDPFYHVSVEIDCR